MNNPTNPLLGDVNDPRSLAYEFAQTESKPAPGMIPPPASEPPPVRAALSTPPERVYRSQLDRSKSPVVISG